MAAAAEPVPDSSKRIHQRHFELGIEQVMASKRVMQQSIFAAEPVEAPQPALPGLANLQPSQLLAYGLPSLAVVLALAALAVALFK